MHRPALVVLASCLAVVVLPLRLHGTEAQDATPIASPATENAGSLFADVTNTALPSPQPCGPGSAEGCYSHYVRLADLDEDGDLDIVFANGGGYFSRGGDEGLQPLVIYRNDGPGTDGAPTFTDMSDKAVGDFQSRLRQVAIGDVDGDGDLDLYAPGSWGEVDALWINAGQGISTDQAARQLPDGLASRAGATRVGDIDGDSDLDLIVTDWGQTPPYTAGTAHLYRNDGTGHFTDATDQLPPASEPTGFAPVDIDVIDVDNDFDLDLILNNRDGRNLLWVNDGTGGFADVTEDQLPAKPSAMSYDVEPCDVDADGDLDLWIDNAGLNRAEQLLINDGSGRFDDESDQRIAGNPAGDDNEINCADVDGDGDFDAVIAALEGNDRVLVNDGDGNFTGMLDTFPILEDPSLSMELGDLDGDAILDAVTAQGESLPQLNRVYRGVVSAPADALPPRLRAGPVIKYLPGEQVVVSFALSDNATTDGGPRLGQEEAFVEWQVDGGEMTRTKATFLGGDLFRAVLPTQPDGATLMVSVRAIDRAGNELRTPLALVTPNAASSQADPATPTGATPES